MRRARSDDAARVAVKIASHGPAKP
jgi:hypothetical protein